MTNENNAPNPLVKLPALRGSATKPASPCLCGCGSLAARRYLPGHDARLAGFVRRVLVRQLDLAWIRTWAGDGVAEAVERELKARNLPHVKWEKFPVTDEGTGTEG